MQLSEEKIPRAVRNEWFYLIARGCMIILTFIVVPIGGWMLNRAAATADEISKQLVEQKIELRILTTEIKIRIDHDSKDLSDHELRLRALERKQ